MGKSAGWDSFSAWNPILRSEGGPRNQWPWRVTIPGLAFAPVIVFIPRISEERKPGQADNEWLPRQCPACRQMAVIGHGRRRRLKTGSGGGTMRQEASGGWRV